MGKYKEIKYKKIRKLNQTVQNDTDKKWRGRKNRLPIKARKL